MRICDPHWDELRQAIDARGLSPFIATDHIEAEWRVRSMLAAAAGADRESFEPLLGAMFSIANNALAQFGMSAAIIGDRCPLCSLATWWIERASREQLVAARRLELVPPTTARGGALDIVPESVPPSSMKLPPPSAPPRPGPPSSKSSKPPASVKKGEP